MNMNRSTGGTAAALQTGGRLRHLDNARLDGGWWRLGRGLLREHLREPGQQGNPAQDRGEDNPRQPPPGFVELLIPAYLDVGVHSRLTAIWKCSTPARRAGSIASTTIPSGAMVSALTTSPGS